MVRPFACCLIGSSIRYLLGLLITVWLYQPPENLTPVGFPTVRKCDSMRHVDDSRSGQHVGNRDYTPRSEYFAVAGGGGADGRRQAGAAHPGHCHGAGCSFAVVGGASRCHGPADAARLGASLQRGWLGRMAWPGWWTGPGLGVGLVRPKPGGAKWRSGWKTALTSTPMAWRWRRADPRDRIAAKFNVHPHERGIGKPLKKLNFSGMSVRPAHPRGELEAREAFKKTSPSWRVPRSRGSLPAGRSKSGFRMNPPFAIPKRFARWNPWLIAPALASKARRPASGPSAARVRASGATGGSPGRSWPRVPAGEACWNGQRRAIRSAPSARRAAPAPPWSCRHGHAGRRDRRHEPASGRNRQMRQRRCHRPADPRRCLLARFATTHPAREYRAHAASIPPARAELGRKHMGLSAPRLSQPPRPDTYE